MYKPKPTSRFIFLTLTLVLFLTLLLSLTPSRATTLDIEDEDSEGIEEILALEEQEEEEEEENGDHQHVKSSEAEVLSKAQRIVIDLNTDNTKRVIDGNEFVLVLGYAPWCARSAELMPQFAEAATGLKELGSTLLMAKVDAERYPKAASNLGIKGYPTLLLFVNGSSQPYTGGFTSKEIVIWARKKTGEPVVRISSIADAKEFLKKHSMFVVGLFEKFEGFEYEEFTKAATSDDEIQFVETNSIDVANVLSPNIKPSTPFIGLVKSVPERYTAFEGSFKMEEMLQFLDYNKFPLVTTVTELNSVRVYSSPIKLQVHIFAEGDDFKKLLEPLQKVARKFKPEIMFLYVDIKEENLAKPFLTLFGLEDSEDTVVAAFNNKISSKYLLESDPTPSKIEAFCLGLLDGTLAPYYKSQPIPDNKEASIQTIVGKTFDDLILRSPKSILLENLPCRPYKAEVAVKSLAVSNIYVGEGTDFTGVPTKMLTINASLRISVYNPATFFGIHVSSTPINLVYSEIPVATGQLKKYSQPRKSHRIVLVNLKGTKVPLYGAGSSLVGSNNGSYQVPLTLQFEIRSRGYVVGKLVRTKHRIRVSCPLVIDSTSTKPIKFMKDSCVYQ